MRAKNSFSVNIQWDTQLWTVALIINWRSKIAVIQRMRILALLIWLDCFCFSQCPWNQIIWLSVLSSPWQSLAGTGKCLNNIGSDGPPVPRSIFDKTRCILPEKSCKQFCSIWFAMLSCCEGARKSKVSCDLLGCHWVSLPCWMDPDYSLHLPTAGLPVCRWTFLNLNTVLRRAQPSPVFWGCFLGWGAFPQGCSQRRGVQLVLASASPGSRSPSVLWMSLEAETWTSLVLARSALSWSAPASKSGPVFPSSTHVAKAGADSREEWRLVLASSLLPSLLPCCPSGGNV